MGGFNDNTSHGKLSFGLHGIVSSEPTEDNDVYVMSDPDRSYKQRKMEKAQNRRERRCYKSTASTKQSVSIRRAMVLENATGHDLLPMRLRLLVGRAAGCGLRLLSLDHLHHPES